MVKFVTPTSLKLNTVYDYALEFRKYRQAVAEIFGFSSVMGLKRTETYENQVFLICNSPR